MKKLVERVTFPFQLSTLALVAISLTGCPGGGGAASGPPKAAVSGKVSIAGKPADGGGMLWESPRYSTQIQINKDGTFKVSASQGPAVGPNKVKITPSLGGKPVVGQPWVADVDVPAAGVSGKEFNIPEGEYVPYDESKTAGDKTDTFGDEK